MEVKAKSRFRAQALHDPALYPANLVNMSDNTTSSTKKATEANGSHIAHSSTIVVEGKSNRMWIDGIPKLNKEIEEQLKRFEENSYSEYKAQIDKTQNIDLFSQIQQVSKRWLAGVSEFEGSWTDNLLYKLGEERGRRLIEESHGQARKEQLVQTLVQVAECLDLEDRPDEDQLRRTLSSSIENQDKNSIRAKSHARLPSIESSPSMPTPPTKERSAGPSGLKRPRPEETDSSPRALTAGARGVSLHRFPALSPSPFSISDGLTDRLQDQGGEPYFEVNSDSPKTRRVHRSSAHPLRPVQHPDLPGWSKNNPRLNIGVFSGR